MQPTLDTAGSAPTGAHQMIDDYQQVVTRAFVEPYTPELRALVRVCGDHFEQTGDPRGTLIALGEARFDARGREGYRLQRAIDQHVLDFHAHELGDATAWVRTARTLALEWRCGQVFGARFDLRRIARDQHRDAVRALMSAPAAATLRRLTVRVRRRQELDAVLGVLWERAWPAPLEHLFVLTAVRPRRLGGFGGTTVLGAFPRLFAYAHGDVVHSLMPNDLPHDAPRIIAQLADIATPLDETTRALLGRCLTHADPNVRLAALDRAGELGEAAAIYVELLALLLQPGVFDVPEAVVAALRAIGPAARPALDVLVRVPGRVTHYDLATRKAAGALVASLREP